MEILFVWELIKAMCLILCFDESAPKDTATIFFWIAILSTIPELLLIGKMDSEGEEIWNRHVGRLKSEFKKQESDFENHDNDMQRKIASLQAKNNRLKKQNQKLAEDIKQAQKAFPKISKTSSEEEAFRFIESYFKFMGIDPDSINYNRRPRKLPKEVGKAWDIVKEHPNKYWIE